MNRIPLDDGESFPGVKFQKVGDSVEIAIVEQETIPWIDYATQEQKVGKDGKPRSQDRTIGFVTGGNATVGQDSKPVMVGQLVAIYAKGKDRWAAIEAKQKFSEEFGRRTSVGDYLKVSYTGNAKSEMKGGNDRKVKAFEYGANNDEAEIERCVARHKALMSRRGPTADDLEEPEYNPFDEE